MRQRRTSDAGILPYIPFSRTAAQPFYQQIYEGYREAIVAGRLRPGQGLPSTRALAAELGISRLPVVNAFEQLVHEGYVEGRAGSGTYVKDSIPDELGSPIAALQSGRRRAELAQAPHRSPPGAAGASRHELGLRPFRVSLPALDRFPHRVWDRLLMRHGRNLPPALMAYGDPAGHLPLREAIAHYLRTARAVRCDASQVLIVSGSQMALQLCARVLLASGGAVGVEEPGYPGARDALGATGAALVAVAVGDEGMEVSAIASLPGKARAVYVTPSHQYPLGTSMAASRRLELLQWARRGEAWIFEDDYDSEYRYASRPLGALQGMDTASRVIYVGTFSKVLFPSLRLGYLVVPQHLVATFSKAREALDIFSPTLYQLAVTDFIREGHFARHLRRMRTIYLARRDALLASLREHCGRLLTVGNTEAGLHLTALLPAGMDDREVTRRAQERGVTAMALSTCYAEATAMSGLLLGFGGADERSNDEAARTLGGVIREMA